MNISGATTLPASTVKIWAILTDPQKVSQCAPGIADWNIRIPNQEFELLIRWDSGLSAPLTFPVTLQWTNLIPPQQMNLTAAIQVGSQTITVTGQLQLIPLTDKETEMQFTAVLHTTNPLITQIARNTAPKYIDTFCLRLQQMAKEADTLNTAT
ncbi:MAG: hypothetical protein GY796_27900 [Chloroflexi bacterium]|nr:hypothetical protein [Chloroflexota bacterium]